MRLAEKTLIMMPCSGKKLSHWAPAKELYTGVMWQSLRVHLPEGCNPVMPILSAEHGFLNPVEVIAPYELRMTGQRASEMVGERLGETFHQLKLAMDSRTGITSVLIVGGIHYRKVMNTMVGMLISDGSVAKDAEIEETTGGIGFQRQQLGLYLDQIH